MRYKLQLILIIAAAFFAAFSLSAADELLIRSRSGDIASQLQLATEYFYGKNRRKNLPLSLYWFRKAAAANSPHAQYNLALFLHNGIGTQANPAAAFHFYGLAMNQGISKAAVRYAEMLFSGVEEGSYYELVLPAVKSDPERALDILRKCVKSGETDALLPLARYLFADAASHGAELRKMLEQYCSNTADPDPEALVIYAACLRSGLGGFIPDPPAGAAILRKAAEKKHPEAIAQLAEMMFNGFGMPADRKQALKLYDEARKLGSSRAMTDIAGLKQMGIYMPHDPVGAFELLKSAGEKNYPPALKKLGDCYADGIGTEKNHAKALEFYQLAAEKGSNQAAFLLGCCFRDGQMTPKNYSAAFSYFHKAALAGHPGAMREAGKALLEGRGVVRDYAAGMEFIRTAARAGDREAAEYLR
ncbi:MAG: sel1 repeat family protein [Lentisphaerae bacterium]|nr:sel1 repeat family protein [Lentisphaerota bacterium]